MSKPYATQMIQASKVYAQIETVAIATKPTSESQLRPLTNLEPEQQRVAWDKAVETAPEGKLDRFYLSSCSKKYSYRNGSKNGFQAVQDASG